MATLKELSDFLASIERKAYKQAFYALREEQAALDGVQDAMMKLAEKYKSNPVTEFPFLFQRILQNTIRDRYRRQKTRSIVISFFSPSTESGEVEDSIETFTAENPSNSLSLPDEQVQRVQVLKVLETEIKKLPARQREAFLMRYWDGMDVSETAKIMRCSAGSVKTHCSRAAHALATALKAKGISL